MTCRIGCWVNNIIPWHVNTLLPCCLTHADADRLVNAADLATFGKLITAVAKKHLNLPGGRMLEKW